MHLVTIAVLCPVRTKQAAIRVQLLFGELGAGGVFFFHHDFSLAFAIFALRILGSSKTFIDALVRIPSSLISG